MKPFESRTISYPSQREGLLVFIDKQGRGKHKIRGTQDRQRREKSQPQRWKNPFENWKKKQTTKAPR